jgi:hypothetical protein
MHNENANGIVKNISIQKKITECVYKVTYNASDIMPR